jgi:hypothetical protein
MKRGARWIVYAAFFLLAFAASGEVLTAVFFPQRLQYIRENKYTISENVPGFRGREFDKEFAIDFTLNQSGRRGEDLPYRKGPGTKRVLFLGDSFLASLQVPLRDYFVTHLTEMLNRGGHGRIENIPVGVGGWDNVQELIYLKNEGIRYAPDLVAVFLYAGNDINGNYGRWYVENLGAYAAREDLDLNYRRREGVHLAKRLKEALLQNSHFFNLMYNATRSSRFRETLRRFNRKTGVIEIPERSEDLAGIPREARIRRGWAITFHLMDLFKEYCRKKGVKLVYIIVPDNSQIYPDHFPERFRKIRREYWGMTSAQPRLVRALKAKGIDHIDLTPYLAREARRSDALLYFRENEHWTRAGHLFVAGLLADSLGPRLAASPAPRDEEDFGPPANGRPLLGFEKKIYGAEVGAAQTN